MKIIEFSSKYTEKIIDLILPIQTEEFGVNITCNDQPDLKDITSFYQNKIGNFWISLSEHDEVVGSIGLVDIGNSQVALRKMFVKTEYRGKDLAIAKNLLNTAIAWCRSKQIKEIYLGTTAAYYAAHRFYEKNGFIKIELANLPINFPVMGVDSRFYKLAITSND